MNEIPHRREVFIHDTVIVENEVVDYFDQVQGERYMPDIGNGTKIWAFSHICKGAKIGKNCVIGEGVYIGPNVEIGDNVKIQNHALIYEGVTIEDDVFIGPNVVTTNDIMPRAKGDWKDRFCETVFKRGCSIGANSTIVCDIEIGENSMIGAGSVVTKWVGSNELWFGNPATFRKHL